MAGFSAAKTTNLDNLCYIRQTYAWINVVIKFRLMPTTLLAAIALAGCAHEYTIQTPYDPSTDDWAKVPGTATIKGQAFLKTRGGDVKTCAGNEVLLLASNPRRDEVVRALENGFTKVKNATSLEIASFQPKRTRCDAQGNFSFLKLPTGTWWLETKVVWEVPVSAYATSTQGGAIHQKVETSPDVVTEVIVTK